MYGMFRFAGVGLRNISSVVSCVPRGPERPEIKLRQRWRRRADSCRPVTLKGAANRGGGSKRRGPERAVGHNGGALARSVRAGVLTRVRSKGKELGCVYTSNPHKT